MDRPPTACCEAHEGLDVSGGFSSVGLPERQWLPVPSSSIPPAQASNPASSHPSRLIGRTLPRVVADPRPQSDDERRLGDIRLVEYAGHSVRGHCGWSRCAAGRGYSVFWVTGTFNLGALEHPVSSAFHVRMCIHTHAYICIYIRYIYQVYEGSQKRLPPG